MVIIQLYSCIVSVASIETRQRKLFVDQLYSILIAYINFIDVFLEEGASIFPKNSKVKHLI